MTGVQTCALPILTLVWFAEPGGANVKIGDIVIFSQFWNRVAQAITELHQNRILMAAQFPVEAADNFTDIIGGQAAEG